MSAAQLIALTAPDSVTGGTAGALRTVAWNNLLPTAIQQCTSGARLRHGFRFPYTIASGAVATIKLAFDNWYWHTGAGGGAAEDVVGNTVTLDDCSIEYAGITAPVTFSASRSLVMADNAAEQLSDAILPATFSLASFPVGTVLWVKGKMTVTLNQYVPVSRYTLEVDNTNPSSLRQAFLFGAGDGISSTDTAGAFTGTLTGAVNYGYAPIMLGTFVTGDPKTVFIVGDSITYATGMYSHQRYACIDADHASNPIACIQAGQGGAKITNYLLSAAPHTQSYYKYARAASVNLGTNELTPITNQHKLLQELYAGGIEKILYTDICPHVDAQSPGDSYLTEAGQTYVAGTVSSINAFNIATRSLYRGRQIAAHAPWSIGPTGIKGTTDPNKYYADGSATFLSTIDGTHPSKADTVRVGSPSVVHGQARMEVEVRTKQQAITVPQP